MWNNLLKLIKDPKENQEIRGDEAVAAILVRAAKTDGIYTKTKFNRP